MCQDLKLPAMFYHSVSATREISERYEITVGIANLLDTRPPRASSVNSNGINNFGSGVLYSQYDLLVLGRGLRQYQGAVLNRPARPE